MQSKRENEDLAVKRIEFAQKLIKQIEDQANIIYVDESSCNSHQRQSKAWSYSAIPVNVKVSKKRFGGVTIFGAIGSCLKRCVFKLGASTNKEEFLEFL